MNIFKLNKTHIDQVKLFFDNNFHFENFTNTYLDDLKNFHAYGKINKENKITDIISYYESHDDASYYITNILHLTNKISTSKIFEKIINYNEQQGRLKFYLLMNTDKISYWNETYFSKKINERYGYFDEFQIPSRHQCVYTLPWQILFYRTLSITDNILRCYYLKQENRKAIPIGGRL